MVTSCKILFQCTDVDTHATGGSHFRRGHDRFHVPQHWQQVLRGVQQCRCSLLQPDVSDVYRHHADNTDLSVAYISVLLLLIRADELESVR